MCCRDKKYGATIYHTGITTLLYTRKYLCCRDGCHIKHCTLPSLQKAADLLDINWFCFLRKKITCQLVVDKLRGAGGGGRHHCGAGITPAKSGAARPLLWSSSPSSSGMLLGSGASSAGLVASSSPCPQSVSSGLATSCMAACGGPLLIQRFAATPTQ